MLSGFHPIPERYGRTDRIAMSVTRVSMLTRDKNFLPFVQKRELCAFRMKNFAEKIN